MTEQEKYPEYIRQFFDARGITEFELVEENARKGRYCFSFREGEKQRFLKWNMAGEQYELYHSALFTEQKVYQALQGKEVTPVYVPEEDYPELVVSEFLTESETLRSRLKKLVEGEAEDGKEHDKEALNDDKATDAAIRALVEKMLTKWRTYVETLSQSEVDISRVETGERLFKKYLSSILTSGPFDTKAGKLENYMNRARNKFITKFRMGKVRKMIGQCGYEELPFVHGDFHANNILVAGDEPMIIDLESTRTGIPEIELAYMYAQIVLLIRDRKELIHQLNQFIKKEMTFLRDRRVFAFFFRIYYRAIRKNHRFY